MRQLKIRPLCIEIESTNFAILKKDIPIIIEKYVIFYYTKCVMKFVLILRLLVFSIGNSDKRHLFLLNVVRNVIKTLLIHQN